MNYSICSSGAIPPPTVFGAEVISLAANPVLNFTGEVSDQLYYNNPSVSLKGVDYCNITITYTHPGQNDEINVETWLPMKNWNGRLQSVGGGGWVAGRFPLSTVAMSGAIGQGYATSTTDAGLALSYTPDPWAQVSPGNVDLYALQNLASVSLNDQAIIAKALIESFYGQPAKYSYWSGCSQGGRQGLMLAQRYPDAYDGIAASAPANNWAQFIPAVSWAQVMMNLIRQYPHSCEFGALTDAAVQACDPLDGVTDGIISDPDSCAFDPFSMVGKSISCDSAQRNLTISEAAAMITNATWTGPRTANGDFLWYGLGFQARLIGSVAPSGTTSDLGYAMTTCSNNGTCGGAPLGLGEPWLKYFVHKDPSWDFSKIKSVEEYSRLFHKSVQEFDSIIGTADSVLEEYAATGGKIVAYHGLADGLIPSGGTRDYYNRVARDNNDTSSFFRYFEVPGLGHCSGGNGGQPTTTFQSLVDWVEKGIAPETLPIHFNGPDGKEHHRILCPYPEKPRLKSKGLDVTRAESWECSI